MLQPVPMTREELAHLLRDIAGRVSLGDSHEGHLQYLLPDEDDHVPEGTAAMVVAGYRVGNRTGGQGGFNTVGDVDGEPRRRGVYASLTLAGEEIGRLQAALQVCEQVLHRTAPSDAEVHAGQQAAGAYRTDWNAQTVHEDLPGFWPRGRHPAGAAG